MKRREVWWVTFDPSVGGEIKKKRPAVIPLSLAELRGVASDPVTSLKTLGTGQKPVTGLLETIFTGFFPLVHKTSLNPRDWYASYYQTYMDQSS